MMTEKMIIDGGQKDALLKRANVKKNIAGPYCHQGTYTSII